MGSLSAALRQHAPAFLRQLPRSKQNVNVRQTLTTLMRCRTGELGSVHYGCKRCGREHWAGRSCGNRHCATCGHDKTQRWLEKQSARLLTGVHHFLVTFTVPKELRDVLRTNQRAGYEALFRASSRALVEVAAATRALKGSQLGFLGVLHTWGRDPLVYHPHVHYLVPGGGAVLDKHGRPIAWKATPANFLVHHGTLIKRYKKFLAEELRAAGLFEQIPRSVWHKKFVVDIAAVDDGRSAVAYLAPYIHRVAISNHRIKNVDATSVTYQYKPTKSKSLKTRTVDGDAFVRGFAQHVLPKQFRKVRYSGWMASNSRTRLEELRMIVWFSVGWVYWLASGHAPIRPIPKFPALRCAGCGEALKVLGFTPPERDESGCLQRAALTEHARAYLDSG